MSTVLFDLIVLCGSMTDGDAHRWIIVQLNLVGPLYQIARTVTGEVCDNSPSAALPRH